MGRFFSTLMAPTDRLPSHFPLVLKHYSTLSVKMVHLGFCLIWFFFLTSREIIKICKVCNSFNKLVFKWNWGPTCPAFSGDNQLFCFRHTDEASMASMSGLDLRPHHYLVMLRAFSWVWLRCNNQEGKLVYHAATQRQTMNLIHTHTQNYSHITFAD